MNARIGAIAVAVAAVIGALVGWGQFAGDRDATPPGIAVGNGRLEADQIDIAAKFAGRVAEIRADEGDMVAEGDVLARMDTEELEAELDGAEAEVALAREELAEAEALVVQRESETRLARHELDRARSLLEKGHISTAQFESRQTDHDVAEASLGAARAKVATARRRIAAREAAVRRIESKIEDSVLRAPARGRVLYRLAEPGEVVPAGGALLTLLSLGNVYMEVFLPAMEAGRLAIGAEGRIVLDILRDYAIPAEVSFVSPEAQFTPKQVETLEEREKLVFRVRVRVPPRLVERHTEHVKTGLRGVAYVRLDPDATWPERLERRIPEDLLE